ncbi:YciI family protein [Homoserinibacter sp. YIM 151385]|uniref:YciI family protein n=1 Tax=Homoserinibacter sp. YIM 151385 TaxID=2985506 RepID=UPI0022F0980B|nr:YciI family protein [Homoserinibacter sp. YIM 151385]WBU36971.1 YciI family protein [Homoserinibacter sp. YIM 151385]
MKYMLIMRQPAEVELPADLDFTAIVNAMGAYNESLMEAGVLLAGEGLAPAEEGLVIDFEQTPPLVTDGPYGEVKELFNGFWIIQTATREEAVEWAKRCPLGPGMKLELRRVTETEEFDQENEYVQKEYGWREQLGTDKPVGA